MIPECSIVDEDLYEFQRDDRTVYLNKKQIIGLVGEKLGEEIISNAQWKSIDDFIIRLSKFGQGN